MIKYFNIFCVFIEMIIIRERELGKKCILMYIYRELVINVYHLGVRVSRGHKGSRPPMYICV